MESLNIVSLPGGRGYRERQQKLYTTNSMKIRTMQEESRNGN